MNAVRSARGNTERGRLVRSCRGQATTELLLVSVWFFAVVLMVIELTVTMAGGEAASYIAYMSARANTAGASAQEMGRRLKEAIPWTSRVDVGTGRGSDGNDRFVVKVPSPLVFEIAGRAPDASGNLLNIEASAEMPRPVPRKGGGGDNDLF